MTDETSELAEPARELIQLWHNRACRRQAERSQRCVCGGILRVEQHVVYGRIRTRRHGATYVAKTNFQTTDERSMWAKATGRNRERAADALVAGLREIRERGEQENAA